MTVIKFAPGLKPVLKHAQHNQQTHGSWANGVSTTQQLLLSQASKFETYEQFHVAVSLGGLRPKAWHIADKGFELDPNRQPTDRIGSKTQESGLFLGDPEYWQEYATGREIVIEYDVSGMTWTKNPLSDTGAKADFYSDQSGNQGFFVRSQGFGRLKEVARLTLAEAISRSKKQKDEMPDSKAKTKQIWDESRSLLKHAQHDQSTHGNWATGGGGAGVDITGELDELFFNDKLEIKESKIFPGDLRIVARAEIARAGLNKKTVDLIEKMSEAQVASGQAYADNALKLIAERQGFTGKPQTVQSVADLEKIQNAEGGTLVYRGIANYSAELNAYSPDKLDSFLNDYANRGIDIGSHPATYPAEQALIDFREGEYFGGWGVFGNGTYTTTKKDDADSYANTIDPERGVIGRGKTMAMLIPKTAKAPTKDVVKTVVKDIVYGGEPNHRNNVGRRLASLGYQYYDAGYVQDDKGGIFVVLDRSMITVAEKAVG